MGHADLRKGRYSLPGHYYHVVVGTNDRLALFTELPRCRVVAQVLGGMEAEGLVANYAWVLMPDHLHWIFQLGEKLNLSEVVRRLKGRTSRRIGRIADSRSGIWQRAFFDRGIRANEDLFEIAKYVVNNPVRAGLVEDIGQYPYWDACWLPQQSRIPPPKEP